MASISASDSALQSRHSGDVRPKKRARAGTADEPGKAEKDTIPEYDVADACDAMSEEDVRRLLLKEAATNPRLTASIRQTYHSIVLDESTRVIDFDRHSKSVWREINIDHSSKSGSRQYEAAGDVSNSVRETITDISEQVHPHSPFATKRSALETLRKIGKTICLSGDTLGHEVRKEFEYCSIMEDGMQRVVGSMTEQERLNMCEHANGEFLSKLRELIKLSEDNCIMEKLHKVLRKLEHGKRRGPDSEADSYLGEEETESEDEIADPGDYD